MRKILNAEVVLVVVSFIGFSMFIYFFFCNLCCEQTSKLVLTKMIVCGNIVD